MSGPVPFPAVSVRGLAKTFVLHQQGAMELTVLDGVDLDAAPGECVVLDGPSGSGKSTLLKCLYGTYRATRGTVRIAGTRGPVDIVSSGARALLELRRDTVGYVSQFLRAIPRVPAIDIVAEPLLDELGDTPEAAAQAREAAARLLTRLRVPPGLWSVPPATFSGGEQQRVNIARGLVRPRPVLLLDEPTASLDAANRDTVIELVDEARAAGAAVIGIFHDARVREALATRTVRLGARPGP